MMTVQEAIRDFSSACERFRWALQHEWMFESRLTEDSHPADFQRLLDMIRERCGISNELVALSQAAVATLTAHGMEDAALSVSRVAVASQVLQGYVNRWPEMWFDCKSHLAKAAIVAGGETPSPEKPGPEFNLRSDTRAGYFKMWAFLQKNGNAAKSDIEVQRRTGVNKDRVKKLREKTRPPTADEIEEHRTTAKKS